MEKVQLKNICRPKQWKTLTGKNLVPDGKYPVYGANGIIGYYNDYNHENETLMIGCRGTCGALNISQPFSYINGNAMALDDLVDDIDIRYLYYALMGRGFQDVISGAVQPQIIRADLEKMEVWIGNKKEQKEIVDVFNKLDTVLSHRKREIQYLDDLIKARFIELFGDPQRNPHGYKHTKLSDIATYYNGLTYKPENVATEGTIVLRSSNIQNSQLDFADTVRVDCAIKERLMVQKNDILMCSRNGSAKLVGKVALIKDIQEPMSFGAFMMIIRSHYFGYLMTYFQMDAFRQQIKTSATTTINQITGRMLDDVTIPLPPMSLVDKFATFVEQIDKSKLLSGCRLFHSWAPENRDKPKHVGVPRRRTKDLRGGRRQQ